MCRQLRHVKTCGLAADFSTWNGADAAHMRLLNGFAAHGGSDFFKIPLDPAVMYFAVIYYVVSLHPLDARRWHQLAFYVFVRSPLSHVCGLPPRSCFHRRDVLDDDSDAYPTTNVVQLASSADRPCSLCFSCEVTSEPCCTRYQTAVDRLRMATAPMSVSMTTKKTYVSDDLWTPVTAANLRSLRHYASLAVGCHPHRTASLGFLIAIAAFAAVALPLYALSQCLRGTNKAVKVNVFCTYNRSITTVFYLRVFNCRVQKICEVLAAKQTY